MKKNGYTLVEVLVASVILVIVIVAAVTALRKGVELEVSDNHRRAARALITSELERNFNYEKFVTIKDTAHTDTLDRRNGNPLTANVNSTVFIDTLAVSGEAVQVKKVTVKVTWLEPGVGPDTLKVEKWLADPK